MTLRCVPGVGRLRKFKLYKRLRAAIAGACARDDFSICQYSVQGDHLHIICEARDEGALANGMRSLANRITKKLNKLLGRRGSAFEGRYHARALKNPHSVRNALAYVLLNARKHGEHCGQVASWTGVWVDPYSSAYHFTGWRGRPGGRLGAPPRGAAPGFSAGVVAPCGRLAARGSHQPLRNPRGALLNLAKGAGKPQGSKAKARHYQIARGSASEVSAVLDAAAALELSGTGELEALRVQGWRLDALLAGLVRSAAP